MYLSEVEFTRSWSSRELIFSHQHRVTGEFASLAGEALCYTWIVMRGTFWCGCGWGLHWMSKGTALVKFGLCLYKCSHVTTVFVCVTAICTSIHLDWVQHKVHSQKYLIATIQLGRCSQTGRLGPHWNSNEFATYLMHNFIFSRFIWYKNWGESRNGKHSSPVHTLSWVTAQQNQIVSPLASCHL